MARTSSNCWWTTDMRCEDVRSLLMGLLLVPGIEYGLAEEVSGLRLYRVGDLQEGGARVVKARQRGAHGPAEIARAGPQPQPPLHLGGQGAAEAAVLPIEEVVPLRHELRDAGGERQLARHAQAAVAGGALQHVFRLLVLAAAQGGHPGFRVIVHCGS